MKTVQVEVITPERVVYNGDVRIVVARGLDGELGIMPNHMPLVTPLSITPVRLKQEDESEDIVAVSGGFMEVNKEKVTILAEAAELSKDIDVARAEASKDRAEQRLAGSKDEFDFNRAKLSLERALVRLKVAKKIM